MRWNFFAATAIIPTLARIVLAMAFIATGLHKISGNVEYTAEEAATLKTEFNITLEEVKEAAAVAWVRELPATQQDEEGKVEGAAEPEPTPTPVQQQEPAEGAAPPQQPQPTEPQPTDVPPADAPAGEAEDDAGDADADQPPVMIEIPAEQSEPVTDEAQPVESAQKYRGLPLHQIALMLHNNSIPNGKILAWIAALTEFVGGVLILIGLFSRVWGLGLAITMAVAFYLTSMQPYFATIDGPLKAAAGEDGFALFNLVFCQLGLGVLALTVFLVGPGPLSLDRLIFRPRREVIEVEEAKG